MLTATSSIRQIETAEAVEGVGAGLLLTGQGESQTLTTSGR
jgi:hypothetical protein